MKKDPKTYKQSFRKVNKGKSFEISEKKPVRIYIRGIPEKKSESSDQKIHTDIAQFDDLIR